MKTKNLLLIIIGILLSAVSANSQSWVPVSNPGFAAINQIYSGISMATYGSTPYIAFTDTGSSKAIVMKYDGVDWVAVGNPGFSAGSAFFITIAINKNGTPYVLFIDGANGNKETVMKFDGTNWVLVGAAGFSSPVWVVGFPKYNCLVIDTAGVPYIGYFENSGSCCQGSPHIWKFDGISWIDITGVLPDGTDWITLAIDSNNILFLGYNDSGFHLPEIYYLNGSSWISLLGGLNDQALCGSFTLDKKNNILYFGIQDLQFSPNRATLYMLNGINWNIVSGLSGNSDISPSITIDSSGTPFLYYLDHLTLHPIVMNFDGSNWASVGNLSDSCFQNLYSPIVFDNNNTPYLALVDANHGNNVTVLKYDLSSGITKHPLKNEFQISPNPTNGHVIVSGNMLSGKIMLEVYDMLGGKVYSEDIVVQKSMDFDFDIPDGIYFVHITSPNFIQTQKLIVSK